MDAWEVLGLPAGERDDAAIRRAYAAKLKQHRPDQDPEGFRRVRDAYEALSGGRRPSDLPSAAQAPSPAGPTTAPGAPAPAVPLDDIAALAAANAAGDATAMRAAVARLTAAWRDGRLPLARWQGTLAPYADGRAVLIADLIGADDLAREMAEHPLVAPGVLAFWALTRNWDRLVALGTRWLDLGEGLAAAHASEADLGLAHHLALVDHATAQRLVERAFQRHRAQPGPGTEQLLAIGGDLDALPAAERRLLAGYILDRFATPEGSPGPALSRSAQAALRLAAQFLPPGQVRTWLLEGLGGGDLPRWQLTVLPPPPPPWRTRLREWFRLSPSTIRGNWPVLLVVMLMAIGAAMSAAQPKKPPVERRGTAIFNPDGGPALPRERSTLPSPLIEPALQAIAARRAARYADIPLAAVTVARFDRSARMPSPRDDHRPLGDRLDSARVARAPAQRLALLRLMAGDDDLHAKLRSEAIALLGTMGGAADIDILAGLLAAPQWREVASAALRHLRPRLDAEAGAAVDRLLAAEASREGTPSPDASATQPAPPVPVPVVDEVL